MNLGLFSRRKEEVRGQAEKGRSKVKGDEAPRPLELVYKVRVGVL